MLRKVLNCLFLKQICVAVCLCCFVLFGCTRSNATEIEVIVASRDVTKYVAKAEDFIYFSYDDKGIKILDYTGSSVDVVVPNEIEDKPVVSIGYRAFSDANATIKSVTLPNTVESIEDEAFMDCKSLNSIKANGVRTVGTDVFKGCVNIGYICLGEYLTDFSCDATMLITPLKVYLPSTVTHINAPLGACRNNLTLVVKSGSYIQSCAEGSHIMYEIK